MAQKKKVSINVAINYFFLVVCHVSNFYLINNDQINTIKMLWTKLKYNIKDRDKIYSLPFSFKTHHKRPISDFLKELKKKPLVNYKNIRKKT